MIQLLSNAHSIAEVKTIELQHYCIRSWHERMQVSLGVPTVDMALSRLRQRFTSILQPG